MTQPNKVIDGIFKRLDKWPSIEVSLVDGRTFKVKSDEIHRKDMRRFLAESLVEVLEKVYNTPDADESIANAYDMLKALKENHD